MRLRHAFLVAAALLGASSVAARPIEVTRFHTAETVAQLTPGWVGVAPAPEVDGGSLETRVWLDAVSRALARHGMLSGGSAAAARIAEVRFTREDVGGGRGGSPVSVGVGVGGGSGGWHRSGTGVGLGLGFGIGGGSGRSAHVASELFVVIRDASTRARLWEGRAVTRSRAGSKEAGSARTAERLASALFAGFPGRSGETIEVR